MLHSNNIKRLFCNVTTNDLLSVLYYSQHQIYLFNMLHSPHAMCLCSQVSCRISGLTFGQSKGPNHFLRNSFAVISLPLLPPLCFLMCLHNLVEHFPWPITIRREKENPALTPQRRRVQREGMKGKLK